MSQPADFVDRRRRHFQSFIYSFIKKRRVTPHKNQYVDVHEAKLFYIVLFVLLLCSADAYLTMLIISNGGSELNPVMDKLIKTDVGLFFMVKFAVTALGVMFFLVHKNFVFFRVLNGYHFLFGCLGIYLTLFVYELYLISQFM